MKLFLLLPLLGVPGMALAQPFPPAEITAWQQRAQTIEIVRDTWGIPHIYGKTDADAVFGAIYAQCEDDFARVEENYIDAIGRYGLYEGKSAAQPVPSWIHGRERPEAEI